MNNFIEYEEEEYDSSESENQSQNSQHIRINTAPARPLTDLEEFKCSSDFILLEQAVFCSSQMIHQGFQKYDLDSNEGQKRCKKFLQLTQKLCDAFSIQTSSKDYRNHFSKAYQVLYKDGQLNYLTEILDSAQEGFPYLFVNGQKYVFSSEVLNSGNKLLKKFYQMQQILRSSYSKICQDDENFCIQELKNDIVLSLEDFDRIWCRFEHLYVTELMIIETDARKQISKAIEIEKELQSIEIREKMKGHILVNNEDYHQLRKQLVKIISQINAVANFEGKGRDDLTFDILLEAEGLIRRISPQQSKAVRNIADKIRISFIKIRKLLRDYEQNIEMVDPQLKNNQDLVELLQEYETAWEKGKHYFIDSKKCAHLIHFSHILETTSEKYIQFKESLEYREVEIFTFIPCLLVLKNLEKEDKNICQFFFQSIYSSQIHQQLQKDFDIWKNLHLKNYDYYNMIEKQILNIKQDEQINMSQIQQITHKIKQIAIEMERSQPTEWNSFLEAALQQ